MNKHMPITFECRAWSALPLNLSRHIDVEESQSAAHAAEWPSAHHTRTRILHAVARTSTKCPTIPSASSALPW
jgi:hypothetical protein